MSARDSKGRLPAGRQVRTLFVKEEKYVCIPDLSLKA